MRLNAVRSTVQLGQSSGAPGPVFLGPEGFLTQLDGDQVSFVLVSCVYGVFGIFDVLHRLEDRV